MSFRAQLQKIFDHVRMFCFRRGADGDAGRPPPKRRSDGFWGGGREIQVFLIEAENVTVAGSETAIGRPNSVRQCPGRFCESGENRQSELVLVEEVEWLMVTRDHLYSPFRAQLLGRTKIPGPCASVPG